jgi:hypothetical protein
MRTSQRQPVFLLGIVRSLLGFFFWYVLPPPESWRPQTNSCHRLQSFPSARVVDATNSIEEARSSTRRQVSNLARLAHSRVNPPCSRSQLKLPTLLEVAGDSALSRILPRGILPHGILPRELAEKFRQTIKGGAVGPAATTGSRDAGDRRKRGKSDILECKLDWDGWNC